eukprot:jgi/Botrbrau1/17764/Bobra.0127s0021.1
MNIICCSLVGCTTCTAAIYASLATKESICTNIHTARRPSRGCQTFIWQEDLQGVAKFVTRALESYLTLPGSKHVDAGSKRDSGVRR